MVAKYLTGYNGTVRTLESLLAWSQWQNLDPELQRRVLAIMDASIIAGRPLGIGSIFRTFEFQRDLFLSRHYEVANGGCCSYNGKRYQLRPGMAHAAPPGLSYHEATTPEGMALAIDFIGDLNFLVENEVAYGLRDFADAGEKWHGQPREVPNARRYYVASIHAPLKVWALPGSAPEPAPTYVGAPIPTLKQGAADNAETRALQLQLNFWGWRDALNRNMIVDGDYGPKTAQAVMSMQRTLGLSPDGVYGPVTAAALQKHLDAMSNVPTPPPVPVNNEQLKSGESMSPGQSRVSLDGNTQFVYQSDGNVVLYKNTAVLWASGTYGKWSEMLVMQADGNLVLYAAGGVPVWSTGTHGNPGALLIVQDGTAFVMGAAWKKIWTT